MNKQYEKEISFNIGALRIIIVTIITSMPLMLTLIPVLLQGAINEEALGAGGRRYNQSPLEFFATVVLCTLVFFLVSFVPMCLNLVRGYFLKFEDESVDFKGKVFAIDQIEKIESSWFLGQNYKFIFTNGENFTVSSRSNRNLSSYIENRFSKMIIS